MPTSPTTSAPRALASALPAIAFVLAACNPTPPEGTGGTDVAPGPFGRGVVSVNIGDSFDSTNVSLIGIDGRRLSESFISSTSLLSSDVYPPTMPVTGDDIILLDRKQSIVTWVNVRTAAIRAQLHVDDARARNPWDYLPVADDKAFLLRYDPAPDQEHGDIVVVNPAAGETASLHDRVDLAASIGLPAGLTIRPARGVLASGRAYITTVVATPDYKYAPSQLVILDTVSGQIIASHELSGLHDCVSIALSPSADRIAVGCSGDLEANGEPTQSHAGIAVLSIEDPDAPAEVARLQASDLGEGVPGFFLSFVTDTTLLVAMLGNVLADIDDAAVTADITTGSIQEIHRAPPIQLGSVLCPARVDGSSQARAPIACFVSDAAENRLLRFPVEGGALGTPRALVIDEVVGLPPRYLGQF